MANAVKHILAIFLAILTAVTIMRFITPAVVHGDSMYPTLKDNDYIIALSKAYLNSDPEYGDIVAVKTEEKTLIKRVIGKPGDTISIYGGKVHRNGETLDEDYAGVTYPEMTVKLGEDEYFVMGDNREVSLDSREIGAVSKASLIGKAVARLYPEPTDLSGETDGFFEKAKQIFGGAKEKMQEMFSKAEDKLALE